MLNHLQAASRLLARVSLALFTSVVLLLIQSAFWSTRVSAGMQIVILATALVSYFRPQYGLLAVAALAPLGRLGSSTLESQMRGAEALVLAFLAGVLVRGWTLRRFRTFPSTRLETAAVVFGLVVAASCAEQIWFLQVQRDFPLAFAGELLIYASRNYLTSYQGFGMIFNAMLLLEGLALLCLTVRYAQSEPRFHDRAIVAIAGGAVAVVLLTFGYRAVELVNVPVGDISLLDLFTRQRWSVHISDLNAAGSYFAMAMFIVFGLARRHQTYWPLWGITGVLVGIALLMTFSRTALIAVALVAALLVAAATVGRLIGTARAVVVTGVALPCLMVGAWHLLPPDYFGPGAVTAITVRRLYLEVTGRMLADYPLFGVGIGQYALWSQHYATPEMFEYYRTNNAHNNFAQIAGELGFSGLLAFVFVLMVSIRSWFAADSSERKALPVLLGLAAFMLTWLGGHPLLIPEVAVPFWITLGTIAALFPIGAASRFAFALVTVATAVLAISIPYRVVVKSGGINFSRVTYGMEKGRITGSEARFFVPAERTHLEFPLRSRAANEEQPVNVDVFVDDIYADTITVTDREWLKTKLVLPQNPSSRFHQIDLRIRESLSDDGPFDTRREAVEIGSWEIITKPNG